MKDFLSETEPVRRYLYGLLAPLATLLVALGVTTDAQVALWVGVATAVLGVPAVETARSKVTPV